MTETSDGFGFVEVSSSGLDAPDGLHVCVVADCLVACDGQRCCWTLFKLVELERLRTSLRMKQLNLSFNTSFGLLIPSICEDQTEDIIKNKIHMK